MPANVKMKKMKEMAFARILQAPRKYGWHLQNFCKHSQKRFGRPSALTKACCGRKEPHSYLELTFVLWPPAGFGLLSQKQSNPRRVSDFTRLQSPIRGAFRALHACKVQSEARFGLYTLVKCNPRRISDFTRLQSPIRGAFRTLHACKVQSEARFGLYTLAKSNPRRVSGFTRLQSPIRGAFRTLHACKMQSEARFGL